GHAGLDRGELEAAGGLPRDEVEVRGLAADHTPERDDAYVPARLRQRHRGERELEGARYGHDDDRLARDAGLFERREGAVEELGRDLGVEPRDDEADGPTASDRAALEELVAVRDPEVAAGVLLDGGRLGWRLGGRFLDDVE